MIFECSYCGGKRGVRPEDLPKYTTNHGSPLCEECLWVYFEELLTEELEDASWDESVELYGEMKFKFVEHWGKCKEI